MKTFKDKQRIIHPKYGECIFRKVGLFPNAYNIVFEEFETQVMQIGNDSYNQLEAVEDLPEVGEYAYFWDDNMTYALYSKFQGLSSNPVKKYLCEDFYWQRISKTPPNFD